MAPTLPKVAVIVVRNRPLELCLFVIFDIDQVALQLPGKLAHLACLLHLALTARGERAPDDFN
eukprot:11177357-Prorocentrum_lima.AAC.1